MAKAKAGLPDGFDIGVTSQDLAGPATLPDYLDDDPVLELSRLKKEHARELAVKREMEAAAAVRHSPATPPAQAPVSPPPEPPRKQPSVAAAPLSPSPVSGTQAAPKASPRRRLQINLDPEGERMVEELLDLVSDQSSERRIKISEFVQALVLNLYNARSEISLGSLPQRGRWGSPTAKSFPTALAQAFREAIVSHDRRIGGNQFKKAIGG
jgi:hypothetical protein